MKSFWWVGLVLAGTAACGHHEAVPPASAAEAERALTPAQLSFLKFAAVSEIEASDVADLAGTIEFDEERTARLGSQVAGRVTQLLVQLGDRVDAGAPLVAIDSPDVRTAQAEYIKAESDAGLAQRTAERSDRLHKVSAIAEKDWQQAQADARKASAELDRARAGLERLHLTPGEPTTQYFLRAPLAGTVVERRAAVGMETGAESGDPLVVVTDLSRVRVNLRLPERQLGLVDRGQPVTVRGDAYAEDFPGTIVAIGDVIDDATRTIPVRCTVANPERLLKPAMFARVTLKAPPGRRVLALPATALVSDGQHFQVLVRTADGHLEPRRVDVGAELGGEVQVLSGLRAGEEVVTEGALFAMRQLGTSG
jgi:membrane fusion protein, heavy metal efflux system